MLCKYNYLTADRIEHGWFQCDVDDFKKFFKSVAPYFQPTAVNAIIVHLQDGQRWMWQRPPYYIFGHVNREKRFGGWYRLRASDAERARGKKQTVLFERV